MSAARHKVEFGDFQTPLALAEAACALLKRRGVCPDVVIEPACGTGGFIDAAAHVWGAGTKYYGFDINPDYIARAAQTMRERHPRHSAAFCEQNFFDFDWDAFVAQTDAPLLFLGNPPWVTSAALGALGADNLPPKANIKGLTGLNARTGKANFDVSEWMLLRLAQASRHQPFTIAMLCKTGVARKALEYLWKRGMAPQEAALYRIDALQWFGAAVDACLFYARFAPGSAPDTSALLYDTLDSVHPSARFGLVEGEMASSVDDYLALKHLCGVNYTRWRSGVKHDLAKIMELDCVAGELRNGLGDVVDVEESCIYPLLKASDIAKGNVTPSKRILITQTSVGANTEHLQQTAPKTWRYLTRHNALFAQRKSSIYRTQPSYCLFGIGAYSFTPYKVAISGLHKSARFTLVPPFEGKPVMLDDTCYFVGRDNAQEASLLHMLFDADITRLCLRSMLFADSKRPVTAEILNRLDIKQIAATLGCEEALRTMLKAGTPEASGQGLLVFSPQTEYDETACSHQPLSEGCRV